MITWADMPPGHPGRELLSGDTIWLACQADSRFSYGLHVPTGFAPAEPTPGVVVVHGTEREAQELRAAWAEFSERLGAVVVAPLFPAGVLDEDDIDSYKVIDAGGIRFDEVLFAILDDIALRWGMDVAQFHLFGHSGGGQFTQRMLLLHPDRLASAAISAPGRITLIHPNEYWPRGTGNTLGRFGVDVDPVRIAQVPILLTAGAQDTGEMDLAMQQDDSQAQRGGMPDDAFAATLQKGSFFGKGMKEDIVAEVREHPLCDELWPRKIPDYEAIEVPAYVVASYSNTLHTQGTFRAWRRIASKDKWLRIHNSQEWPDYYDEQSVEELRRFFDHYLRGVDNDWEQTPRVRYAVLGMGSSDDQVNVAADSFPPADVTAHRFYLDAVTRTLDEQPPTESGELSWDSAVGPRRASFLVRFDEPTRLVGYPSVHLFTEARGSDDMDVFVTLQKLDARGIPQEVFTVPNHGAMLLDNTDTGGSILRYKGANGQLRASMRHLDEQNSTEEVPAHTFDRVEKLTDGQVVELVIDLSPIGWQLQAGEGVRLVVSSTKLIGPMMPGQPDYQPHNNGQHVLHTGSDRASWLRLPIQA